MEAASQKHLNSTAARPFNGKECIAIPETAFGCPRDFLDNRFVYAVISARATVCRWGEHEPGQAVQFQLPLLRGGTARPRRARRSWTWDAMAGELHKTLTFVLAGKLHERPFYSALSEELFALRHVP